ncbi:MAG TPA: hypothetical protein VE755_09035 [Myxococcales bacterium]|nr:hypothetical protein [Myxococcales bacterium]
MRLVVALLLAFPAGAAPLKEGTPHLQLRLEGLLGQPTTQLGTRGGIGLGVGWRMTDQLWIIGDAGQRAAPGGGIGSLAFGLQATLDATPISPYLEVAMVDLSNRKALGYSLATRTGLGADWMFSRGAGIGIVVRTYTALDPVNDSPTVAGLEGAVRLVLTPGAL